MDSQNKSSFSTSASTDSDEARRRFLASMGIGDIPLDEPSEPVEEEFEAELEEEEVALSSQPDDLELPGAPSAAPVRNVQSSPEVQEVVTESPSEEWQNDEISEPAAEAEIETVSREVSAGAESNPAEPEEEVAPEASTEPLSGPVEDNNEPMNDSEEGPLQLSCPKCHGELVLMPEHVGVEGACVWCETKIVAARSGSDGEVRVFPLFQPDPVSTSSPVEKTVEANQSEETDWDSKTDEVIPSAVADSDLSAATTEIPKEEAASPAAEEVESPSPAQWSGGFDSAAPAESESPEEASEAAIPSGDFSDGFAEVSPKVSEPVEDESADSTLDFAPAPEAPSGFEAASPFSGDAAPSASPEPPAKEGTPPAAPSGFGQPAGFSDAPTPAEFSPEPEKQDQSAPETGGLPEGFGSPAGFSGATPESAPPLEEDATSETPDGFANGFSADPFGDSQVPSEEKKAGSADLAEAGNPDGFSESWGSAVPESDAPPAGFSESPFFDASPDNAEASGNAADLPPTPVSSPEDAAPKPIEETSGFQSGFEGSPALPDGPSSTEAVSPEPSMWGSSDAAPATEEASPNASEADSSGDAPLKAEAPVTDFGSGFAIPASDQSSFPSEAATPEVPASGNLESIFGDAGDESPAASAATETWGATQNAPGPPAATPAEPLFTADGTSESEDEVFGSDETQNADAPALFESPTESGATPPPIPGTEEASAGNGKGSGLFASASANTSAPQVTSKPLGSKPAKKRSKGMVVMLVIILGLVCGAALASFVLPVDEYVEKARSFVEQKLNMETEVDPALFLSEMVTPGDGASATTPGQPPAAATQDSSDFNAALEAAMPPVTPAPEQAPATSPASGPAPAVSPPTSPQAPVSE